MENFNWTSFTKKVPIKSTVSELYKAWTVPKEIEKWFLSEALYKRANGEVIASNESIAANDRYEWSWFLYETIEKGKVLEANGVDCLKFTFAGDCIVTISLTQKEETVIVSLTQSNIPTDNQSKRGIRIGCDSGWSFFLVNLKSVYEGGLDLRNKDESLTGMLND